MVQSNEFTGRTLLDAVRLATAAYDRSQRLEQKNEQRCNDLVLEMSHLSREAARYADEAARLADEAEALRREAIRAGLIAIASLLGGLAAWALKARRIARALGRMRKGDYSRETILEFLLVFGAVSAVASAVLAAEKFLDSQELVRRAMDLDARAERTGEDYLKAFNEYDRLGCGESRDLTGA